MVFALVRADHARRHAEQPDPGGRLLVTSDCDPTIVPSPNRDVGMHGHSEYFRNGTTNLFAALGALRRSVRDDLAYAQPL